MTRLPGRRGLILAGVVATGLGVQGCSSAVKVEGTARLLNGATPGGLARDRRAPDVAASPLTDGRWVISPDQVQVRVVRIQFFSGSRDFDEADLGPDCVVTYSKAAATLSPRLECPFELDSGTYARIDLQFATDFRVLIDDETHGLFTDPASSTLLSTTRPVGGAQFVDYGVANSMGSTLDQSTQLTSPLVVSADAAAPSTSIDVVLHGLHTMAVDVSGGVPAFPVEARFRPLPVLLYPSVNGVSTSEYYSSYASAESYNSGVAGDAVRAVVFYETGEVPAFVSFQLGGAVGGCGGGIPHAANASPEHPYTVGPNGEKAGGYLGLDQGLLCWAQGTDETYARYSSLISMTRLTAEGTTGTLSCQNNMTAPPPVVGNTYSSGCPTLTSAHQISTTLVAN